MKKVEKSIKDAKKTIEKFTKGKQEQSNDIKSFIASLELKTKEISIDLKTINDLKDSLKEKKKKIEKKKSEIKDFINSLTKLARSESKELLKRKKEEKALLIAKEKKEANDLKAKATPKKAVVKPTVVAKPKTIVKPVAKVTKAKPATQIPVKTEE